MKRIAFKFEITKLDNEERVMEVEIDGDIREISQGLAVILKSNEKARDIFMSVIYNSLMEKKTTEILDVEKMDRKGYKN